ncbi:MAG TPA: sugar transferase [Candidatus Nanopelagicales bacterium]
MSLVGPRPIQQVEADALPESEDRRHITKPGFTGLWQISGRNNTTWDERMRLDLYYVENWSPALDLVILIKTAKAVVSGRGAC